MKAVVFDYTNNLIEIVDIPKHIQDIDSYLYGELGYKESVTCYMASDKPIPIYIKDEDEPILTII